MDPGLERPSYLGLQVMLNSEFWNLLNLRLISGVGKTTTAYLVSKELGYDVMELNASDTRSKKLLEQSLSDALSSTSVSKTSKKRVMSFRELQH